ncbi:hypothetical protein [Pedobacter sp. WC2423]|uniref:hypothetical protein n=1 Tax=Pedobacter sp. WC2423 TaxID=3234142 RepID=UPI003465736C
MKRLFMMMLFSTFCWTAFAISTPQQDTTRRKQDTTRQRQDTTSQKQTTKKNSSNKKMTKKKGWSKRDTLNRNGNGNGNGATTMPPQNH